MKISLCLSRSNSTVDRRCLHNMEDFIQAATAFHKAASTTAGSMRDHSREDQHTLGLPDPHVGSSVVSRMPTFKRQEIVTLLRRNGGLGQIITAQSALQADDAEAATSPERGPQLDNAANQFDFTTVFTGGFSKLAHKAIQDLDFIGAENFLRRAMEQYRTTGIDDAQHRRLRKQLALSLFFQGRDKEAKELVLDLSEHYGEGFNTTSHLLFALALSLAHNLEFEEARAICEQLCQINCISDSGMLSRNDIFKLLVTCYRQSRDWMSADAIIAEIPEIDEEQCISSPLEFILSSEALILEFLGDAEYRTTPSIFISQVQSLPIAKRVTRLQERLDGASIFTTRFATSENGDDQGIENLLRLESGNLQSAPQAAPKSSNKKHASSTVRHAHRLCASLKHLAFKSRLHSSFQLLKWQRCTHEAEKVTPVHDILSWIGGQVADHGTATASDRLYDHAEYSLAMSGFNDLPPPISELDSIEISSVLTATPEVRRHVRAFVTPSRSRFLPHYAHADSSADVRRPRKIVNGLKFQHIQLSSVNEDGHPGSAMTKSPLSRCPSYTHAGSAMRVQKEGYELPGAAQDTPVTRDVFLQAKLDPALRQGIAPELVVDESLELTGVGTSITDTPVASKGISGESSDSSMLQCPKCQWTPDCVTGFRARAAVDKHCKRNHLVQANPCPVCPQNFRNRPDNVKPHVERKHPEVFERLYGRPRLSRPRLSRLGEVREQS